MRLNDQLSVVICVSGRSDDLTRVALELLNDQVAVGAADNFLACTDDDPLSGTRMDGSGGNDRACVIFDELASMRKLRRIRLVAVASEEARGIEGRIAASMRQLKEMIQQSRGHGMTVDDIRVLAPATGKALGAADFFSAAANANIIVIPHDRLSDRSFARHIPLEDNHRFAAHLAVELASATALWASMDEGPFDDRLPVPAADFDPQVFLTRSMVRALHCPGLASDSLVRPDRPLPLPESDQGFVRSTDPEWTIEHAARSAVPTQFLFSTPSVTEAPDATMSRKEAYALYRARFGTTLLRLPQMVFSSLSENVDVLTADAIQEAVGRESWVKVLVPDYDSTNPRRLDIGATLDETIAEIERSDESPVFAEVNSTAWRQVVDVPLAVADGGYTAGEILEAAGDRRFLVTDRELLAPSPSLTAEETIADLDDQISAVLSRVAENNVSVVDGEATEAVAATGQVENALPKLDLSIDDEGAISDSIDHQLSHSADAEIAERTLTMIDPTTAEFNDDLPQTSLLVRIGAEIRSESLAAESHLRSMLSSIRHIVSSSETDYDRELSTSLRVLLNLGLATLCFGLIVFTGAAAFSSLEWLGSFGNRIAWGTGAVAIAVMSITVVWSKHARGVIRTVLILAALAIAVSLAVLPWVRNSSFVVDHIGRGRWMLWPLTAGLVIAASLARGLLTSEDAKWRRALSRINFQVAVLFAFLCIVVAASSYRSFLQPIQRTDPALIVRVVHLSDDTRRRLLIIVGLAGLVITLAAVTTITARQVQQQLRQIRQSQQLSWSIAEARRASRDRRRLELLYGQWLGTAAAIARIFWHPLGAVARQSASGDTAPRPHLDLKKFDVATLELTARGTELLADRVRSTTIHRGWLRTQYNRATESFVSLMPRIINENVPREDWPMPENCSAVASLRDIESGEAQGDRWSFMRALYEGDFDSELASIAQSIDVGQLFSTVLTNHQAARLVGDNLGQDTALDFLESLLPAGSQVLPTGLVAGVVFIAEDPKLNMETKIAWPAGLTGRPAPETPGTSLLQNRSTLTVDGSVVTAVRIDISQPFALSAVAGGFTQIAISDQISNENFLSSDQSNDSPDY